MTDQKNLLIRRATFKSLLEFIEEENLFEKYPSFIPVTAALSKRLLKIESLRWISRPAGHNSAAKKKLRRRLSEAAYYVSLGVYAFAQITKNIALKNAINYSFSDFYRPLEATMIGRCRQVLNSTKKVKNPEHYGLTKAEIENLQGLLKEYLEFMNKPMESVKARARAVRQVEVLLNQCLNIVQHQLDPLVTIISRTEHNLLSYYNSRRRIDKPAGRKRKYVKKQKKQTDTLLSSPKEKITKIVSISTIKQRHLQT